MQLPDRFAHLSTNNPPTPLETASIQEELATQRKALVRYQRVVRQLAAECQAYEALLAPLRRMAMPPEILGSIFHHVILDTPPNRLMLQLQNISLICKAWRDAALATLHLWVNLDIVIPRSGTIPVHKIKSWFSRSGTIPKRLRVRKGAWAMLHSQGHCPLQTLGFADLLAEGHTIEGLSLVCGSFQCFRNLFQSVHNARTAKPSPWDSMMSLDLAGGWKWGDGPEVHPTTQVLPHMPASLSSLSLFLPFYDDLSRQLRNTLEPLVLPSLEALDLQCDWPVSWILKTLSACSNVKTAALNFGEWGIKYDGGTVEKHLQGPNPVKATLPSMQTLRLSHLASRHAKDTGIFRLLSCPSIAELDISFENGQDDIETLMQDPDMEESQLAPNLAQFVKQSNCTASLRVFRLHGLKISSMGLIPVLHALPSITHLILEALDVDEYLCQRMARRSALPRLEVLECIDSPFEFGGDEFGKLVRSRTPSQIQLDKGFNRGTDVVALKQATLSHFPRRPLPSSVKQRYWPRNLKDR